jgi:hypothetical protein
MQSEPLLEKIDWFFTSNHWTTSYPNTSVKELPRPVSDHIPCLVSVQSSIPRSKVFHFENYWPLHPGFKDTVKSAWQLPVHSSDTALALSAKFKNLRRVLKRWSEGLSKLSLLLNICHTVLALLDKLEESRPLVIQEWNFRIF